MKCFLITSFPNWCTGILNLFDVMAFGTIFSQDMKTLPVTISWLWSRFILKLSVKFVRKFPQKLHKMQNLFLAHTSNLDCTWCLLNLVSIGKC